MIEDSHYSKHYSVISVTPASVHYLLTQTRGDRRELNQHVLQDFCDVFHGGHQVWTAEELWDKVRRLYRTLRPREGSAPLDWQYDTPKVDEYYKKWDASFRDLGGEIRDIDKEIQREEALRWQQQWQREQLQKLIQYKHWIQQERRKSHVEFDLVEEERWRRQRVAEFGVNGAPQARAPIPRAREPAYDPFDAYLGEKAQQARQEEAHRQLPPLAPRAIPNRTGAIRRRANTTFGIDSDGATEQYEPERTRTREIQALREQQNRDRERQQIDETAARERAYRHVRPVRPRTSPPPRHGVTFPEPRSRKKKKKKGFGGWLRSLF